MRMVTMRVIVLRLSSFVMDARNLVIKKEIAPHFKIMKSELHSRLPAMRLQ